MVDQNWWFFFSKRKKDTHIADSSYQANQEKKRPAVVWKFVAIKIRSHTLIYFLSKSYFPYLDTNYLHIKRRKQKKNAEQKNSVYKLWIRNFFSCKFYNFFKLAIPIFFYQRVCQICWKTNAFFCSNALCSLSDGIKIVHCLTVNGYGYGSLDNIWPVIFYKTRWFNFCPSFFSISNGVNFISSAFDYTCIWWSEIYIFLVKKMTQKKNSNYDGTNWLN